MNNKNLELQINKIIENFNKGLLDNAKNDILRLIKTNFNIPFLHNLLGLINHTQNNLNEAKSNYKKATQLDKNYSIAFNNLGGLLIDLDCLDEAKENLLKANRLEPKLIDVYINLGNLEAKLKNYNQEIIYYKKALEIDPNSEIVNYNLSTVYISQHNFYAAKKYLKKTIDINPKFHNALTNMGGIFLAEGEKEKAISYFNKAVDNNPDNAEAYRLLSDNIEFTSVDDLVKRMKEVAKKNTNFKKNQMHINFALGKAFDDLKKFDEAFSYFMDGNNIRKELLNYNIDFDKKLFKSIKSKFKIIDYKHDRKKNVNQSKIPIFIVGLPRSGTTLVEQIISCHSNIYGAGELSLVDDILFKLNWKNKKIDSKFIENFRSLYLGELSTIETNKLLIADKMPLNFRWLGLIQSAIPEAKIIHVERNNKATMWSIYKKYFTSNGNAYAYDLNDIQEYYKMYKELMSFWNSHFLKKIYNLNYEKLTKNQEEVSKELIKFLNLDWEQECLQFQNNRRFLHTASALQVKKQMYQGSSNEWKNYKHLLPESFLNLD